MRVEQHVQLYEDTALLEQWLVVQATTPQRITRVDSLALKIAPGAYDLLHFDSDWGQEFEPVRAPLNDPVTLETRMGRSSKGQHPYFALLADRSAIAGSVAWSGNWCIRFEPSNDGVLISGGIARLGIREDIGGGRNVGVAARGAGVREQSGRNGAAVRASRAALLDSA